MNDFLVALIEHEFLQRALIAGVLASIGCGLMGTYVVVRRLGYLVGGIAHAALGGMGIAYFLGKAPIAGAIVAAIIAALIIGWINLRWHEQEDTLISAVWAIGMAIGVLFISQTPGYNVDLMSYLFGNILLVPREELLLMTGLDALIVLLVWLFFKRFLAVSFDEEFARLRGVNTELYYLLLLCLVALTVVLLIQVVGLILVIALLTLPAAIAAQYFDSLKHIMLGAIALGATFTSAGIMFSFEPDLPPGATITLVTGICYVISVFVSKTFRNRAKSETALRAKQSS